MCFFKLIKVHMLVSEIYLLCKLKRKVHMLKTYELAESGQQLD